jgi:hypothetical protein
MDEERGTVLIVEPDAAERDRMATALRLAGFGVVSCCGPTRETPCPVGNGWGCDLARIASVIVLDLALETEDDLQNGVSPSELLAYYLGEGKPVVALSRSAMGIRPFLDERVEVLERPADLTALLRTVERMVRSRLLGAAAAPLRLR